MGSVSRRIQPAASHPSHPASCAEQPRRTHRLRRKGHFDHLRAASTDCWVQDDRILPSAQSLRISAIWLTWLFTKRNDGLRANQSKQPTLPRVLEGVAITLFAGAWKEEARFLRLAGWWTTLLGVWSWRGGRSISRWTWTCSTWVDALRTAP